jgi:hypothetical protein
VKSQRAYVEQVIACIRRIFEDAAPGREADFSSRTLQDAIIRNLQVLCESTQRVDSRHKDRHPEIYWASIAGTGSPRLAQGNARHLNGFGGTGVGIIIGADSGPRTADCRQGRRL